jgi:preprotein translocase subunit SecD
VICVLGSWACSTSKRIEPAADWRRVPVSIELRLAEASPAPGLVPAVVHGEGGTVYLHPEIQLSNADIARVEAVKTRIGQGLILQVWLTRAGAERMAELTRRHIGDSLAVRINSVVVSVPMIQQALNSGTHMPNDIGVPLRPEEASQLAQAVAKTWPVAQPSKAQKKIPSQ